MKKMKKEAELEFLMSSAKEEKREYSKQFGICTPNLSYLMEENREIFDEIISECKRIPDTVMAAMIEEEKYLDVIMARCLSEDNQVKFVEYWPEKVVPYLQILEANLEDGRGAYLCREAEEIYEEIREEDSSLPELKVRLSGTPAINSPFAVLANAF